MPQKRFRHFLLTRFNIPILVSNWKTTKKGEEVTSDDWLIHRFQLFEDYCLPSVAAQTNTQFTWILLFSTETPALFKAKIANFAAKYSFIVPVFISTYQELIPSIKREIDSRIDSEVTHILTSRMDNDDAIHVEFIETIQQAVPDIDKTLIDVVEGYSLVIEPFVRLTKIRASLNPFLTLLENRNNYSTILHQGHDTWSSLPAVIIDHKRLWVQVVHEKNVKNSYRAGIKNSLDVLKEDFKISLPALKNNRLVHLPLQLKLEMLGITKAILRLIRG